MGAQGVEAHMRDSSPLPARKEISVPTGLVPVWMFCSLHPWDKLIDDWPGLGGRTELQGRMNYLASLVLHQAERDPDKVRFQIIGQHGCYGPEYFIRVLNSSSGDLLQDPGIEWLDPEDVPVFLGHATLARR